MQAIFASVNAIGGIVMVHPRNSRYTLPTTPAEIETAVAQYPNTTFILHGEQQVFEMVQPLLGRFANLYFSYDFPSWIRGDGSGLPGIFWSGPGRQGGTTEEFLPHCSS
jgi:hypothetical protein